jgi:hypothetical protein
LAVAACSHSHQVEVPGKPADEVQQLLAVAAKAKPQMYYLGDTYRGLKISDIVVPHTVMYGTCKITVGEEGGCAPPYQVVTETFTQESWANAAECSRLPDIRGVPAVSFGGGTGLIFGTTVVKVYGSDENGDPAAAAQIRPIGGSLVAQLPRPDAATLTVIGKACGNKPGEHGPTMWD